MPAIRADTVGEILRILRNAEKTLVRRLKDPSQAMESSLIRQRDAVHEAITRFEADATTAVGRGLDLAWSAGVELLTVPMDALGVDLRPALRIDDRALRALRNLTTDQIKDIGLTSINKINATLGEVLVGTRSMPDAIEAVSKVLTHDAVKRARRIVYTSVGQAYSESGDEAMRDAAAHGIKIGKRWVKSGKRVPRPSHVAAHNQMVRATQAFLIGAPKGGVEPLRFPRDPEASLANTLNCGCISVPVLDGSTFGAGVVSIPDDLSQPIKVIPRSQYEQARTSEADRINDRLARYLGTR